MIDQAGQKALDLCVDKAVRVADFNVESAQACVLKHLQDGPRTAEYLTWMCKDEGHVPHDDRAFGAVYKGLVTRGLIYKVSDAPRHRGHGTTGGSVYALTAKSHPPGTASSENNQ